MPVVYDPMLYMLWKYLHFKQLKTFFFYTIVIRNQSYIEILNGFKY